ncbi:DUF5710 domain-containing protein [Lysinibacillus sp. FSL M8-0216]|uniref:DUF5710 domain-containing protein n=1 Tax=Lysinibacillus TaxID=400634 RepID=UPI0000F38856|nr:DUF5710 domain-containing protein [Lysinibacillus fusiformis]EAZ86077.1 Possible DNA primase [Bacillus sp. B14905]MED4078295.1 DUF5710 domain-containing protein [Lysinibacillus fusiformis]
MLFLDVPYSDKDEAKQMYAKWNTEFKKWTTTNRKFYFRFKKWVKYSTVATNFVYLAKTERNCWKCKKHTVVYAIAIHGENLIDLEDRSTNHGEGTEDLIGLDCVILPLSLGFPSEIAKYLKENSKCKVMYSNSTKSNYYANVCLHCNSLQGNNFIFEEFDSPFSRNVSNIEFLCFTLKYDVPIDYIIGKEMYSPTLRRFSKSNVKDLNITINSIKFHQFTE